MKPTWDITCADCRVELAAMAARSVQVDAVVTDPPYHLTSIVKRFSATTLSDGTVTSDRSRRRADGYARLATGFMGKAWDGGDVAFQPETWRAVYDVMKPGAHLLAFGGTRTFHRMMVAIEDAGFELRDVIMWCYGSGFPKSHGISKGIDRRLGVERIEVVGKSARHGGGVVGAGTSYELPPDVPDIFAPATAAAAWQGWGSALKPAYEPIAMFRKPLIGTLAENVLAYGAGGLNIDGCRIETDEAVTNHSRSHESAVSKGIYGDSKAQKTHQTSGQVLGRWPTNLILDGSDEVVSSFPNAPGQLVNESHTAPSAKTSNVYGKMNRQGEASANRRYGEHGSTNFAALPGQRRQDGGGSAARFFYHAKANAADRAGSKHPTVKPQALMRYLCRLITPPGGTVLDPFAGSGSTFQAAVTEGFNAIGIEAEPEYCMDIMRRMANVTGVTDAD